MMRLVPALLVIQILALGWLATEMMDLEEQLEDQAERLSAIPSSVSPTPPPPQVSSATPQPTPTTTAPSPSADEIREIVREELDYVLAYLSEVEAAPEKRPALSVEESQERLQATRDNIDAYMQEGRINQADMTSLQQQIATLNPDDRKKALSYLVGAMNSGQLDARM